MQWLDVFMRVTRKHRLKSSGKAVSVTTEMRIRAVRNALSTWREMTTSIQLLPLIKSELSLSSWSVHPAGCDIANRMREGPECVFFQIHHSLWMTPEVTVIKKYPKIGEHCFDYETAPPRGVCRRTKWRTKWPLSAALICQSFSRLTACGEDCQITHKSYVNMNYYCLQVAPGPNNWRSSYLCCHIKVIFNIKSGVNSNASGSIFLLNFRNCCLLQKAVTDGHLNYAPYFIEMISHTQRRQATSQCLASGDSGVFLSSLGLN